MGKVRNQLQTVRFYCVDCDEHFERAPDRIEDAPDEDFHPWRYFAACPFCRDADVPQERQHRHLMKMWARATGPKTASGKAASAANLDGHPTPEAALRTRFNGLKHGLTARTATFWPARPGKYPDCDGCQYLIGCHLATACAKRTDLFLRHHIAFEANDPSMLRDLRANLQANVSALMDMIILAVINTGVEIKTPQWYHDESGVHLAVHIDTETGLHRTVYDVAAHPLLKTLGDLLSKNNLSLADLGMTPKVQDDEAVVQGHLSGQEQRQETLLEYQRQQAESMKALLANIGSAKDRAARDPVLLEHKRGADSDG